jgi:hypothetical protein
MKNAKNNRTAVLIIILLSLLLLAYKVVFMSSEVETLGLSEDPAMARVETILNQVQSISFDTSILKDQKFNSMKSIETPLISLPVGRKNPFSN